MVTLGISADFISYRLSSALRLNEREGHVSLSIESSVYHRLILICFIFKGTVLIVKISFVQAENTVTAPVCVVVELVAGGLWRFNVTLGVEHHLII